MPGKNGEQVYFNVNRHINYTNICVNRCTFCAFSKEAGEAGGYTLALNEILHKAAEAAAAGATELHMVGGLHPGSPLRLLSGDARRHPRRLSATAHQGLHRRGDRLFRPPHRPERRAGHRRAQGGRPRLAARRRGGDLRRAGARADLPGEDLRRALAGDHRGGPPRRAEDATPPCSSAIWRAYADRVDHLARLRALQDRTGGFQAFIPLAFQPDNTRVPGAKGVGGVDALKTLAISRLYLDNFRHIKAYWVMLGLKIAQVALAFGVNDLDGTVVEEKIGHDAGADSPQAAGQGTALALIRKAGKLPVERDTLYRELKVY